MNNNSIGNNWDDIRKEIFTPEEISESNLRVSIIRRKIKTKQKDSQK